MYQQTHLRFNSHIGRQKPESIVNRSTVCPFCDTSQLEDILEQDGSIILLKNKYPVLEDTFQTVLIETDDCDAELSRYSKEHLHRLIRFGISNWLAFSSSGEYRSVLFFKNHGPMSGGTIHHPHMQIVGLKHVDYRDGVNPEHFSGLPIYESDGLAFNISTHPRMGFFELNVVLRNTDDLHEFADYIQIATHYVLNHFNVHCKSYNLFFYELEHGVIAAKIIPRFVVSPLFVGFSIPQVSNRIDEVVEEIHRLYFHNHE